MQATRAKLPRHATDTDDEGEMADADNGMAKARQQTLPHRDGHFATHQMVVTGSLCEIGEHQSGAHPTFFALVAMASPLRRVVRLPRVRRPGDLAALT
jgi:hypothetical protein